MADVIIVPGRGIEPDGTLPPDPISRVKKAQELYKEGRAHKIIMSGSFTYHLQDAPAQSEARAMKLYAESLGVSAEDIIEEDQSMHTLGNAYLTKKLICEPHHWKDIIVVASDDHLERVEYVFRKIYGPEYTLQFISSGLMLQGQAYTDQMAHEKESLRLTKEWIGDVADGDDQTIREIALSKRPNDSMGLV